MDKLLEIVERNVNVKNLSSELLELVVKPALEKAVDKTSTPIDNMAMAALYPILSKEIVNQLSTLWSKVDGK